MDVLWIVRWRVAPLLLLIPYVCHSQNIRILNEEPVHVIPGSDLLLRARIQIPGQDKLSMVTWERETETGPTPNRLMLATCPGSSSSSSGGGRDSPCAGTRPNVQAKVGEEESTLQITGYEPADGGDYIVTVMHQNGNKTSARCIVREYEAVHHVSVSINVSHSVLVCGEAWGTEPHFSWLYNRVAMTQTVGQVSKDGTTLHITQRPICGSFTCMVRNQLGYATATYTADKCEPEVDHSTTIAAVACVVLLLVCGGLMGVLYWWKYRRHSNTRERLHEHLDS